MTRYLKIFVLILTVLMFTVACGTEAEPPTEPEVTLGNLGFEVVNVNSADFSDLYSDSEFAEWYDANYKQEGVFTFDKDGKSYLLICAGEKTTGGYTIDNVVLTGNENNIEVSADLHVPAEGALVTQAITYPNLLLRIPQDSREPVFEGFNEIKDIEEDQEPLTDSGTYVGQIDANSIEIEISGVPQDEAAKAFQLKEELKDDFEGKHGLQSGDKVRFTYFIDEYQRPILMTIEKI